MPDAAWIVEGVEVAVVAAGRSRRVAVEARERAGQDRELLARVVSDHADLGADARRLGRERERLGPHEAHRLRVVAEEAEVVDRIAVHRPDAHALVVQEHRLGRHRPRPHHVAVREDQPALGVDDEARRDRGHRGGSVSKARVPETRSATTPRDDALEGRLPRVARRGAARRRHEKQRERQQPGARSCASAGGLACGAGHALEVAPHVLPEHVGLEVHAAAPGASAPSVVTASVCGISATSKPLRSTPTTVSETPSIATEPFSTSSSAKPALRRDEEPHVVARAAQLAHAARPVHVALHDVAVEAAVRAQRALEVHARARAQRAERGALERLAHRLEGERAARESTHREAGAVHRDAVAEPRLAAIAGRRDHEPRVRARAARSRTHLPTVSTMPVNTPSASRSGARSRAACGRAPRRSRPAARSAGSAVRDSMPSRRISW